MYNLNVGSSKTNSTLWTVVGHIREEEALARGQWRENVRESQDPTHGIEKNKTKMAIIKKVD